MEDIKMWLQIVALIIPTIWGVYKHFRARDAVGVTKDTLKTLKSLITGIELFPDSPGKRALLDHLKIVNLDTAQEAQVIKFVKMIRDEMHAQGLYRTVEGEEIARRVAPIVEDVRKEFALALKLHKEGLGR